MKQQLLLIALLFVNIIKSQDFLGLQSSNYAGVLGAYSNPANLADNRLKVDVALVGLNFAVNNNYVGIKRSALTHTGSIFNPSSLKFSDSWSDMDYKSPTYFKNNLKTTNNGKSKSLYMSNRIVLPSFMINLNHKNSVAFNWSLRNYVNVSGVSQQLANLMYNEFSLTDLFDKRLTNKNLSVQQMAWAEYGLSYARVIKEDNQHFFKAGVTAKLLQGLEAIYINVRNLDYQVSSKDTFSFFNSSVAYGHSDNLNFDVGSNPGSIYKFTSNPGFGFDFGAVYEWRPTFDSYTYEMDGEKGLRRNDLNKYKFKASLAVVDLGGIRFKKGGLSNDFTAEIRLMNLNRFKNAGNSAQALDSTIAAVFPSQNKSNTFKVALPTAINAQADYHIWKPFYINTTFYITNFYKNREAKVNEFTNISIAPRFDHKWFGVTIPVSYNTLSAQHGSYAMMGLMARLGPVVLGSNNFLGYFKGDVYGADFYFLLKVPIPYGHKHDMDKDGISDKKDKCKLIPGVWEFKGCPDKDGDHVQDSQDKCPDVAGLPELGGCPDKDKDGITDLEDACPDSAGTAEFKGCPDRDGDKVIDRKDKCPDVAGLAEFDGCPDKDLDGTPDKDDACPEQYGPKEFKGCPDKDADGIPDPDDACPENAGPKEYKGCPDKDGDSILDKEDGCPEVAGPVENKGCPWPDTDKDGIIDREDSCVTVPGEIRFKGCPPPMKAAEKKIIEKAFASLEFATGKDIIKPKSLPSLNELAKLLVKHQAEWTLKLSGHTDNEGNADANMVLSEKRAKAVMNYLIKKGATAEQVTAEWFGPTQPFADNATAAGRQKNRRVEMKISYKE
ncbi:MAG: OmpA family protein [Bacteroidia bacterium]|nr:OmpA family protein [Bacteroidia bacterium]